MRAGLGLGLVVAAAGILAGCDRAPAFPEVLMVERDTEWLIANKGRVPEILTECEKIMNSELRQADLPIPVERNCNGIKGKLAHIERQEALKDRANRAREAAKRLGAM